MVAGADPGGGLGPVTPLLARQPISRYYYVVSAEMLAWLSVWSEVQTSIWPR